MRKAKRVIAFLLSMLLISATVSQDVYAYAAPLVSAGNNVISNQSYEEELIDALNVVSESTYDESDDVIVEDFSDEELWVDLFGDTVVYDPEPDIPVECPEEDEVIIEDEPVITGVMLDSTDGQYTYTLNGSDEATLTKYKGTDTEVTVPASIDGYTVVALSSTFSGNKNVTKVVIPSGITTFNSYVFDGASALTDVTIPSTVTNIGSYTFRNCISLTSVTLPKTITAIGNYCFSGCTKLDSISIDENITSIGNYALSNTGITAITIPSSVTTIATNAFNGIAKVTFASGTVTIPVNACYGNTALTEVVIPSTVTSIGNTAFYNCKALTEVTLPAGIKSIGNSAFQSCIELTTINLPAALTSIGSSTFATCNKLASITVPKSVTSIGTNAFNGITKVVFEDGMVTIPANACYGNVALTEVVIPSTVTTIGNNAFRGCSGLEALTIPSGVTTIGTYLCYGCSKLTSIVIPDSVETIGTYTFHGCAALESAKLSSKLTVIPDYMFYNCKKLETVSIPSNVTKLGNYVFYYCELLKEFIIPQGVTSIGAGCFQNCTSLEKIVVPESVETIGNSAFSGCSKLDDITIGKDVAFGTNVFGGRTETGDCGTGVTYTLSFDNRSLEITGDGIINDYSMDSLAPWAKRASLITELEIADTITGIGSYAFYNMSNIDCIIIPEGTTKIGSSAFENCNSLPFVELPTTISSVGDKAFYSCDDLAEITFTGNAPVIGLSFASGDDTICIYFPETASGWGDRLIASLTGYDWRKYDDTLEPIDVVLTLDTSGSMSGRMDTLKECVNNFIMNAGGIKNNTRLAIVEYNSNAKIVSDFTFARARLTKAVSQMKSGGNTEYLKALNTADSVLSKSSCENRVIVLFSDGAPTDSKPAIYELAEKLREKYTIFTVGLGVSQSVVLETIAGSKRKFFLAANIDELIEAFKHLSDYINRKDTTEVTMKRHNIRYDLTTAEIQKFPSGSDEYVSIDVIPSVDVEPAKYVIRQGDKVILSSTNGNFNNIQPGKLFAGKTAITLWLYDENDELLEKSIKLSIELIDSYTASFFVPNAAGNGWELLEQQTFKKGSEIKEPDAPAITEKVFSGWYTNSKFEGYKFFSIFNIINRANLENNVNLYAKYRPSSVIKDVDRWSFGNSGEKFCYSGYNNDAIAKRDGVATQAQLDKLASYHHDIYDDDYKQLLDNNDVHWYDFSLKDRIKKARNKTWNGSCFGMATMAVLAIDGKVDIVDFVESNSNSNWTKVHDADIVPNENPEDILAQVESGIEYYYLAQNLPKIAEIRENVSTTDESANIEKMLDKISESTKPAVLGISLLDSNGDVAGGHAVVAYDFVNKKSPELYSFSVYDVNFPDSTFEVTLEKKGDKYVANLDTWYAMYKKGYSAIFLKYLLTTDEIEDRLSYLDKADDTDNNSFTLVSSYNSFVVSDGDKETIVTGGKTVSGNFITKVFGNQADLDEDPYYMFELQPLAEGKSYIVTPAVADAKYYSTVLYNDDVYADVYAKAAGEITVSANGVSTKYATETQQTIGFSNVNFKAPWYYTELSGSSKGFDISLAGSDIKVNSLSETDIDLNVSGDINYLDIADISIDADGIIITSDEARNCIVKKGNNEIAKKNFGFEVVFDSMGGSKVASLYNVAMNTKLTAPDSPKKTGFEFTGWYTDKECTKAWNFDTDIVTKDLVLYAGWSVDPNYFITVTFKMYGGKEEKIFTNMNAKLVKENCPTIEGEDKNWYKDIACTKPWDFEKDVIKHNIVLYSVGWDKSANTPDAPEPTPVPDPTPAPTPDVPDVPTVDPHADDNKVVVKQKIDVSGMFDLSSLGKDEKLAGYIVSEGKKNASITKKGLLSPKKPGDITIEAYKVVKEGKKKVKKTVSSIKLVVVKPEFDKAAMVGRKPGQIIDITKLISIPMNQKVEWSASKSSAATMDDKGMVTIGNKSGKLTVTATLTNKDGKKVKIKGKLVIKLPKLTKSKLSIKAGKSAKLSVRNIVDEASQKITWSTSNAAVAVYDASAGKVVANGKGEAVITAEIEGVAYTCNVKVK